MRIIEKIEIGIAIFIAILIMMAIAQYLMEPKSFYVQANDTILKCHITVLKPFYTLVKCSNNQTYAFQNLCEKYKCFEIRTQP